MDELCAGVEVVPDFILMWREAMGEFCVWVEVVPDFILM